MTRNHEYNLPERGSEDWHLPLNENFSQIDTDIEIRDAASARNQYEPKDGAKFLATDTGKIYLGNGSEWQRLSVTRGDTEFDSLFAVSTSVTDRDNEINVRAIDGATLSERIETALQLIDTSGKIRIPRPKDGGKWVWGSQLDIDASQYRGITLSFDRGVIVEYEGDGWVLTVKGPATNAQKKTFAIAGSDAEIQAISSANPAGFVRADDVAHFTSKINTRGFTNSSGDAVAICIRNIENFSEGWRVEGDHRKCDIGIDFVPSNVTGGGGTRSFVDGRAENLSINYYNLGIRLRGDHKSNVFDSVAFFPRADDSIGIKFTGNSADVAFHGPRFDDTEGVRTTAIDITSAFMSSASGRPVLYNPSFSDINEVVDSHTDGGAVFFFESFNTENEPPGIRLYDPINDAGMFVGRGGKLRVVQNGSDKLRVRSSGQIDLGLSGPVNLNDSRLDDISEVRYGTQRSADPTTDHLDDGESMQFVSDGTGGVTGEEGDLVWATNDGGTIKTLVLAAVSDAS